MNVLQIQQSHHQSGGFSKTALISMIQGAESLIEHAPVDQGRQTNQFMAHVDLAVKAAAEQFGLVFIFG